MTQARLFHMTDARGCSTYVLAMEIMGYPVVDLVFPNLVRHARVFVGVRVARGELPIDVNTSVETVSPPDYTRYAGECRSLTAEECRTFYAACRKAYTAWQLCGA